jgi:hypothetical protein
MSTVICQGCGQAFGVPAGYSRNKIQCPACGVICQVPADAARSERQPAPVPARREPARSVEEDVSAWLRDPAPEPARERHEPALAEIEEAPIEADIVPDEPEPEPTRREKEPTFACRRCGQPVRRQRECPFCDALRDDPLPVEPEVAPQAARVPVVDLAPRALELDEEPMSLLPAEDEDEESVPYETADRGIPRCPKCRKDMEAGAVVCMACWFNVRTRKKSKRSYSPLVRSWETDMTLTTRLAILGGVLGIQMLFTLGWLAGGMDVLSVIACWIPLTLIVSFVVGTYDRVELLRDTRGRVTLVKHWRFCFVPIAPQRTEVRGYEGVLMGGWNDSGFMEWFICILLLCTGFIPALIWWYVAIYQNHYHVALAEDHGAKALTVYRGRSEEQMHEIARVLCDASGLKVRS